MSSIKVELSVKDRECLAAWAYSNNKSLGALCRELLSEAVKARLKHGPIMTKRNDKTSGVGKSEA
jgi:hypothetical protein